MAWDARSHQVSLELAPLSTRPNHSPTLEIVSCIRALSSCFTSCRFAPTVLAVYPSRGQRAVFTGSAAMREPQKIEVLGVSFSRVLQVGTSRSPELDQSRLVSM